MEKEVQKIKEFIYSFYSKYSYNGIIIGISGGIDSAVCAKLCVDSVGKESVFGLLLPERDSDKQTISDSKLVCDHLNIKYKIINLKPILKSMKVYKLQPPSFFIPRKIQEKYVKKRWENESPDTFISDLKDEGNKSFLEGLAYYRVKHRVRLNLLYFEAEKKGYCVAGTTNKTEEKSGFYVKYGDDSSDIEPLIHLYKTEVIEMANFLNIPDKIINKSPSPDLIPGITDEFAMGISYKDLDRILIKKEKNISLNDEDPKKVQRVDKILQSNIKRKIKNISLKRTDQ